MASRAALAGLLLAVAAGPAGAAVLEKPAEQGALGRGQLPPGATGLTMDGKPVALGAGNRFIIGFDRDATGTARLAWRDAAGAEQSETVTIAPHAWSIQSLPGLRQRPVPDAEFEARRPGELAKIRAARATPQPGAGWEEAFIRPVAGRVSGRFGNQRVYAGVPASYHSGLDIAAAAGTPVKAPAAGVVVLADGPFLLEGNLVLVDHGAGLGSALMHLSRIDVRPGQMVAAGDVIGLVGATGRVTGPHLHWGLTWQGARLDPATALP